MRDGLLEDVGEVVGGSIMKSSTEMDVTSLNIEFVSFSFKNVRKPGSDRGVR